MPLFYVYYGFLFSIFFFIVDFLHFLDEEALHKTALEKCWDTDNKISQFALYCCTTKHVYETSFATSFAITYFCWLVVVVALYAFFFSLFVLGLVGCFFHFHTITIIIHHLMLLDFCKSHSFYLARALALALTFFFFNFLSKTVF